jgi:hypothetical protein
VPKQELVLLKPKPSIINNNEKLTNKHYQAVGVLFARGEQATEIIKFKKDDKEVEISRPCIKLLMLDGTEHKAIFDIKRNPKLYTWLIRYKNIDKLTSFCNWIVYPRTDKDGNVLLTLVGVEQKATELVNSFTVTGVCSQSENGLTRFFIYRNKPVKTPSRMEKSFVLSVKSNFPHKKHELWDLHCELTKEGLVVKSGQLLKTLFEEKFVIKPRKKKFIKRKPQDTTDKKSSTEQKVIEKPKLKK